VHLADLAKGKVERSMPTLRQQLVAGRAYADPTALNEAALRWCREGVGQAPHGTPHEPPWVRFERDERRALRPLPPTAFECPTWAEAKVHPDHHLVFAKSYYSVPTRFVGKTVWVRATARLVVRTGPCRSLNPAHGDHGFRGMVITGSGAMPIAFGSWTGIGDRLADFVIGMVRNPSEVAVP
jgi:hypothetical protein